jgi:DNA-binding NtrC family response regulator
MAARPHILLVDDDERLRNAAGKVLTAEGYRVVNAASAREALEALKEEAFALVISDLRLPDLDGIALLKQMRQLLPEAEVVMITGYGSIEKAVEAMQLGAYDFLQKPLDSAALLKTVAKALEKQRLTSENRRLRNQLQQRRGIEALIGDSPQMEAVKQLIRQIAPTDINVLIQGESGTGKEIAADALHHLSGRRAHPFVKISCAAIPETLLESELFGHERGAFTGAVTRGIGRFERANRGTLFLDEIGDLPLELQPKLLRVIQEKQFERLGGGATIHADVRVVCATHRNLVEMVDNREFRADLFYRLSVFPIELPPLRNRSEDIRLLVHHFATYYAARMRKGITAISEEFMTALAQHSWPGNVRELQNVLERSVILSTGPLLNGSLPKLTQMKSSAPVTLDEVERWHILQTLEKTAGVIGGRTGAAVRLGLPRTTLIAKMKRLGLNHRQP